MTALDFKPSRESDLIREIDRLINKIVNGSSTPEDKAVLDRLLEERSNLMHPAPTGGFEERRRRWG